MLCECVGHQRAAVKTPERRGSAHPHSGAATHKIMSTEKEKQWENIMPFPAAHNPGNPGSEWSPIPTSTSSSNNHKIQIISNCTTPTATPHPAEPHTPIASYLASDSVWRSPEVEGRVCTPPPPPPPPPPGGGGGKNKGGCARGAPLFPFFPHLPPPPPPQTPPHPFPPFWLRIQGGAPQGLKAGFAPPPPPPQEGSACVGYISISRGMLQRGPFFSIPPPSCHHLPLAWKLPYPPTYWSVWSRGCPCPPATSFDFRLLQLSPCECDGGKCAPQVSLWKREDRKQSQAESTLW